MSDTPFFDEVNARSHRRATLEDTGAAAYLYLSAPDSNAIVADAWVYNRVASPSVDEVAAYRPDPPPAAAGYAGPDAILLDPSARQWSFQWAVGGESVAICADGVALAFIRSGEKTGYSRHLVAAGPWGKPWSEETYAATFRADSPGSLRPERPGQ